jgi:transposase InsO family protein
VQLQLFDLCVAILAVAGFFMLLADERSVFATRPCRRRHVPETPAAGRRLCRPKDPWVPKAVLRLKALMPGNGCRKIADAFNEIYRDMESVSKSYVNNTLRDQGEEILRLRREIKHTPPRPIPRNTVWGLDLTFLPGRTNPILGLIDHGTRACLRLEELETKSTISLIRALVAVAKTYGLPKILRTDNEPSLCSWRFRAVLRVLGVRHQRTAPHSPWQNGRIERFFATFKERTLLRLAELRATGAEPCSFADELATLRLWYNHIRTHQHLDGRTPAEAWDGIGSTDQRPARRHHYFTAWDDLLTGFH